MLIAVTRLHIFNSNINKNIEVINLLEKTELNHQVLQSNIIDNATNITKTNSLINFITSNPQIIDFPSGTCLLDKYVIDKRLDVTSGEATLYICSCENQKFIAKIYHRRMAINTKILQTLKKLNSPYIVKPYEFGYHDNMPVEILPYYKTSSLKDKTFSFEELKNKIIPCINEALKALHTERIIHKDLKPSNIMTLDDNSRVSIIDFGISSKLEEDMTVLITKTGKQSDDYSAPETFRNIYLNESDYYAFGITLYELFCGYTPYKGLNDEEKLQYLQLQKFPYPDSMPQELQNLIKGLTYNDITHRNELDNPNRRWTYSEVQNWLEGKDQPIPGEVSKSYSISIPPYKFKDETYASTDQLITALAYNWEDGKNHLTRGLLSGFFKNYNPQIANDCIEAEEEIRQKHINSDAVFFKLTYKLSPILTSFYWKSHKYPSLTVLGKDILTKLRSSDVSEYSFWNEILENKLISYYMKLHSHSKEIISAVSSIENTFKIRKNDKCQYYILGYLLTEKRELQVDDKIFNDIKELVTHLNHILKLSKESFEQFCCKLINANNELNAEFEAWLIASGKHKEIANWKQNLRER